MTELTPGYSLPSPVDSEAPNGPAEIKALAEAVETALGTLLPAGSIIATARSTAPNTKWLIAEGQAVSRTGQAVLFAAIGTTYGIGDGSTTFNLPDLRERVPVGKGASMALGTKGGEATVALSTAQMPKHGHALSDPGHAHPIDVQNFSAWSQSGPQETTVHVTSGLNTHAAFTGITMAEVGNGTPHNNLQPYQVVNYLIKT